MDVGVSIPDLRSTRPVELADGTLFPPVVTAYVDLDNGHELKVRIVVHNGIPTVESIVIERGEGPELSAPAVHSLPIGEVVDRSIAVAAYSLVKWSAGDDANTAADAAVRVRRRRRRLDDAHFQEVAAICARQGDSARKQDLVEAVCREMPCSERTAWRWIQKAEQDGLLAGKPKEKI